LSLKPSLLYIIWLCIEGLLALEASYSRSCLNALTSLKKTLKLCIDKPIVIVDRSPWYRWALDRLGLEYRHERFGLRNRVKRFFRYLKERTAVFHHKLRSVQIRL